MSDKYPPTYQRQALLRLAEMLGSASTALRRDECGDWRINGSSGHIYAVPGVTQRHVPGFLIHCVRETKQGWTWAKKALPFCLVTQDGDKEGIFFLDHQPHWTEAEAIRDTIGIRKRPIYTEEQLAERSQRMREVLAARPASGEVEAE